MPTNLNRRSVLIRCAQGALLLGTSMVTPRTVFAEAPDAPRPKPSAMVCSRYPAPVSTTRPWEVGRRSS